MNDHYLQAKDQISVSETDALINCLVTGPLAENPKEAINTQAWILHMMNPSEAWANLRRSDYPTLQDRSKLSKFDGFTYDDDNLQTPVRLRYPILENQYNSVNYNEAIQRMGSKNSRGEYVDDWHHRVWWDTADIHLK